MTQPEPSGAGRRTAAQHGMVGERLGDLPAPLSRRTKENGSESLIEKRIFHIENAMKEMR
jgi:hypothetical protein